MLTKKYITALKEQKDGDIGKLVNQQRDIGSINFVLENLGRLPSTFDSAFLFELLNHQHKTVRLNAVKNIGKLNADTDFSPLIHRYQNEHDTAVKREIISALGRQRKETYISFFMNALEDQDPKVISQAVRSLFVFDCKREVKARLKKLANHSNEMIRAVIHKQYAKDT